MPLSVLLLAVCVLVIYCEWPGGFLLCELVILGAARAIPTPDRAARAAGAQALAPLRRRAHRAARRGRWRRGRVTLRQACC